MTKNDGRSTNVISASGPRLENNRQIVEEQTNPSLTFLYIEYSQSLLCTRACFHTLGSNCNHYHRLKSHQFHIAIVVQAKNFLPKNNKIQTKNSTNSVCRTAQSSAGLIGSVGWKVACGGMGQQEGLAGPENKGTKQATLLQNNL